MMSSSIAAGNKKINVLFLSAGSTVIHHAPFSFLLYLYLSYLRKNIIMFHFILPNKGEANANLILKKTDYHTCTSKQAGDLQGREKLKLFFLFYIYIYIQSLKSLSFSSLAKTSITILNINDKTEYLCPFLTLKENNLNILSLSVV